MPIGLVAAGVGAAATVAGAVISGNAAKSAAKTNAASADKSLKAQQDNFDATTANNKPFLATGTSALNKLAGIYGLDTVDENGNTVKGAGPQTDPNATFYQTPDYKFTMDQGQRGITAQAAASGMRLSGATLKAGAKYAGNLADSTFNNYADRLQRIAGVGQAAANSQAAAGQNEANAVTGINSQVGATNANAILAASNNTSKAIQDLAGAAQYQLGKNPFGSSYGGQVATYANGVTPQASWGNPSGTGVIY